MTCLYRHFDSAGKLLYVGISLSAVQRLASHKSASPWFNTIDSVTIQRFRSRSAALNAERRAVRRENPAHNIQLRPLPPRPACFCVRIDPEAFKELDRLHAATRLSYGQIISQALRRYVPELSRFHKGAAK